MRVPILTPVASPVVVKRLALDVTAVPAVATADRPVILSSTLTMPAPPPCLPPPCGQSGH